MHPLAKKLMFLRQFDIGNGNIQILGQKEVLLPMALVMNLDAQVMQLEGGPELLYHEGYIYGAKFATSLEKSGVHGGDLLDFFIAFEVMSGWGRIEIIDLDFQAKRAITTLTPIDISSAPPETNSFMIFIGLVCGAFSVLFKKAILYSDIEYKYDGVLLKLIVK